MACMTYAYRPHPWNGRIQILRTDTDQPPRLLREGWYDSPEKVPGREAMQAAAEAARQPATTGREPAPAPAPLPAPRPHGRERDGKWRQGYSGRHG